MKWDRAKCAIICLAAVLQSASGMAQTVPKPAPTSSPAPPAPSAAASVPDRTTASFGDWVLRCDRRSDVTPVQRFCELGQAIQRPGDAGPQAQVAIGRILPTDPIRVTALFPVNVAFQPAPQLVTDGRDSQTIEMAWLRCLPTGCFSSAVVSEESLKKFRTQKDAGRLEYRDGAGREVVLGFSFRGFGEAYEAFVRESSN